MKWALPSQPEQIDAERPATRPFICLTHSLSPSITPSTEAKPRAIDPDILPLKKDESTVQSDVSIVMDNNICDLLEIHGYHIENKDATRERNNEFFAKILALVNGDWHFAMELSSGTGSRLRIREVRIGMKIHLFSLSIQTS